MEDLNKKLVNHIKVIFDDFDDENSENGWEKLREKFPEEKKKRLPIWWMSGIAASILLTVALLFLNKSAEKIKKENQQVKTKVEQKIINNTNELEQKNKSNNLKSLNITITNSRKTFKKIDYNKKVNKDSELLSLAPLVSNNNKLTQKSIEAIVDQSVITKANSNITYQALLATKPPIINTISEKKSTIDFLTEESKKATSTLNKKEEKPKQIENSFDVFTSTYLNYAYNSSKINAGFGINKSIKLAKNIAISLGAGISQNNLIYENTSNNNNSSIGNNDRSVSFPGGAVPVPASNNLGTSVKSAKFNAQLLTFDLPIVFKIYPSTKQKFYLVAGINSNSYIKQKYSYEFNIISTSSMGLKEEQKQTTETSNLKEFDFANSAIFAIGINQRIGHYNLIFEPYFKPAIGSMGDKNLRINAAGLNLRFNLSNE